MDYKDYLQSPEWLEIKRKAQKREFYHKCYICGSEKNIHIHHRNYNWLGTPAPMKALIPLCKDCHFAIHGMAKSQHIPLRKAVSILKKKIRTEQSGQQTLGV